MSFSDTLIGVNSAALNTPLNHIIWLNDYKTYGENSYVFKDKRILKELYASPIAANDAQIFNEAKDFNMSYMSEEEAGKWYKNNYIVKDATVDVSASLLYRNFSSWSDEELSAILDAHYNNMINISDHVSIGDKRSVTLSAMEATGVGESHVEQTVEFVIADYEHDTLTTPINGHTKAAITLAQVDPLKNGSTVETGYMNSTNTNSGGWALCSRRAWCNNIYYNALPTTFKNIVKPVNKLSGEGGSSTSIATTSDNVFLFSEMELNGTCDYTTPGEGTRYSYYDTQSIRSKGVFWWERSCLVSNSSIYMAVNTDGGVNHSGNATDNKGLLCGLCM